MNRFSKLFPAVVAAFAAAPSQAAHPCQAVDPDGFPGGDRDNSNILGKKV